MDSEPETPTARDSSAFTRRRMSISVRTTTSVMRTFSRRVTTYQCTVPRGSPGRHPNSMLRSNRRRRRSVRLDSNSVVAARSRDGPKLLPIVDPTRHCTSPTCSGLRRCSPWVRSDSECISCVGSHHLARCSRGCLHNESSSDTDLESLRTLQLPCGRPLMEHAGACLQRFDPTDGGKSGR